MTQTEVTPEWLPDRSQSYLIFGFTGQGQQRPDMLEPWYGYSHETDEVLRHFHDITETEYGLPLDSVALESGPLMQPANVTMGVLGSMALKNIGITPNETNGHSLGEYAAVYSAGFVDFEDIISLARMRGLHTDENVRKLIEQQMPVGMMAVSRKAGNAATEIKKILKEMNIPETDLDIANWNTEDQVVLSGISTSFDAIKERTAGSLRAMRLKVDGPFHSLHMRLAKAAMKDHVDQLPIRQPKSPKLYSPTTVKQIKTREDVASMFLTQLTSGVRYAPLINARLKYLNGRHISNLLGKRGAIEVVFAEIGPYQRGKSSDSGVLIGLNKKNVAAYHEGSMPIRFHRISEPEDLLTVR